LPESQFLEIKQLLADYFAKKVDEGMDDLFEKNNWDVNEKVSEWSKSHERIPYSSK
jgi:hypothetical protein